MRVSKYKGSKIIDIVSSLKSKDSSSSRARVVVDEYLTRTAFIGVLYRNCLTLNFSVTSINKGDNHPTSARET